MKEAIVCGFTESLCIGQVYDGLYCRKSGSVFVARLYVLEAATEQDWREYCSANGLGPLPTNAQPFKYFYFVSTD